MMKGLILQAIEDVLLSTLPCCFMLTSEMHRCIASMPISQSGREDYGKTGPYCTERQAQLGCPWHFWQGLLTKCKLPEGAEREAGTLQGAKEGRRSINTIRMHLQHPIVILLSA